MQFITSDGVSLEYTDQGHGMPVVITTGYAGFKEIWTQQVKCLLTHGYRVINLDRRNHGRSQPTSKGLRMSRQGKDIQELLSYLRISRFNAMGNSMGAAAFWAYCSLFGDQKLNKMISVDQSPKMITDSSWPYGLLDLTWQNFPRASEKMYGVKTTVKRIDDDTYRILKRAQRGYQFDYDLNRPLLYDHAFQDWRDVISEITCPLLFVAGAQSPFWSSDHAQAAADLSLRGQAVVVEHAGHIVMAEQTHQFNELMINFFDEQ